MGFFNSLKEGYMREVNGTNGDYQPGHKNSSGTVKKMALINMFGTSDLDEVFEGCAPHFTETIYGIRDKLNKEDDYKAKYDEIKGKYAELQKHHAELQENYQALIKAMAINNGAQR